MRVIGDSLELSWNDVLRPPPASSTKLLRTISAWGDECQADLARRRVLIVGAGSVGLHVILSLAASGLTDITVMDFDVVKPHNLDRLIGARRRDARLRRPKVHVARREGIGAATAANPRVAVSGLSICEPEGLLLALDHDLIFCCVDRPWPRGVLNALAFSDLIPVIDGGIAIDNFDDGRMRNATWRSHVIRPGRPCMACNGQLNLAEVALDKQGLLQDPSYLEMAERLNEAIGQNVAPLSINAAASLMTQYVSFSAAPGGIGDPGPLRYWFSSHHLERIDASTRVHCPVDVTQGQGDLRTDLTGQHEEAEHLRKFAAEPSVMNHILRQVDNAAQAVAQWLDRGG